MLFPQGRAPRLALAVALVLTLVIVLHLSTFPTLAKWKIPSPLNWKSPPTDESPEQENQLLPSSHPLDQADSVDDGVDSEQIEHESLIYSNPTSSALLFSSTPTPTPTTTLTSTKSPVQTEDPYAGSSRIPCQNLEGGEDVVVVMRTGATETEDKLPVHLNTTFRCFPETVIFSDYGENFHGHEIHDVLKNIPDEIKNNQKEFKHYLHIQDVGREGLDPSELSGAVSEETGDGTGKNDNPGWALDKWKFLPMINETFALYPNKTWYVFIESDSYLVWSNFVQWLPHLDPNKASYFGSEARVGDVNFAHGGSVFLLTRSAMEKVANDFNNRTDEILDFISHQAFGDGALAKILDDNGVPLTFTWPQFQGGNPTYTTDWPASKDHKVLWCTPALSYHHLIPVEVAELFQFEQGWIEDVQARLIERGFPSRHSDAETLLHHKETFKLYIQPNLTKERDNWHAMNDWDKSLEKSHPGDLDLSDCKAICQAEPDCMQYTLEPRGCSTYLKGPRGPRMGQYREGVQSGWLYDRVQKWVGERDHCTKLDWTTT